MSEDTNTQDEGFARPPSNWFKFGKPGDFIKGKLISKAEQDNRQKPGEKQWVYEIEAEDGEFHNIVEKVVEDEATKLEVGETYLVGGKTIIDKGMRKCAISQRCIMRYLSDFKMMSGNTAKTVEVQIDTNFKPEAAAAKDEIPFD